MQCDKSIQLVKAIEEFPCLYNYNLIDYSRKDVTEKAWRRVAKQIELRVSDCKEKWKNLRYGLLRSLRLNFDGTLKKKYYLHDEMAFVLPFIKATKLYETAQPIEEINKEANASNDRDIDSPEHPRCHEIETIEPPKKKSRPNESANKKHHHATNNQHSCNECRKIFLLSLLPEVNALTEAQMRVFRRRVLSLLDEVGDFNPHDGMYCLLEWQKDTVSQDSTTSQSSCTVVKEEPL